MFALAAGLGAAEERVPAGLDAIVGEGGKGLSVGESQRLQLARVIIANPRLLILDEARANLDFATELGQADACQTETGTHDYRCGASLLDGQKMLTGFWYWTAAGLPGRVNDLI